ncbi:MAG TPA: F0F1 ATP synthase subunit gamma [Candidatus Saccharimonadales bacterium]|nr:F0F1 ATP synthase subunit gamma [Candidatus Saccharimonadales bacterium]
MRQLAEILKERDAMATMSELSSAFEGIASMRISQIKDQVLQSQQFFGDLWRIYSQIQVESVFGFGRGRTNQIPIAKELMILITSEGSFSGDIDQRLVREALKHYDSSKNDILVVGHHGAVQLKQNGVSYVRSFKMPIRDKNINVTPLTDTAQKYMSTVVYYEKYISLTNQEVASLQLGQTITERGRQVQQGDEVISEHNYIFEPSTFDVVNHLERSMMQIMLGEVILESKLAQYASRFRAMSAAKEKSGESLNDLNLSFNRARRHIKDERLKEIMNGLRNNEA